MIDVALTTAFVDENLRALRTGKALDPRFARLVLAATDTKNDKASVQEHLENLVWKEYAQLRLAEQLDDARPLNEESTKQHLAECSRSGNGKLAAWCALYFRYLAANELSAGELAKAAGVVPQQFRRRVSKGLEYLTQKLAGAERAAQEHKPTSLPILPDREFTRLVGVNGYLDSLRSLLLQQNGPRFVSLEGMGGIGKSALARALIDLPEITAHWAKIAWVSARQTALTDDGRLSSLADAAATLEDVISRICKRLDLTSLTNQPPRQQLNGLKVALAAQRHLIVVDNLETVSDYEQLIPALAEVVGQSHVLITTRQTLRHFSFVQTIAIQELRQADARELVEAESARRGRAARLSDQDFAELYGVVGGLPLALKLVTGQLYLKPIEVILKEFRQVRTNADDIYRYVYWQAWHSLSQDARLLLLAFLPSDPDGEDLAFLQLMSGLPEDVFYAALKELAQFSLLEGGGSVSRPTYRLHRLTTTFLQTDVLRLWSQKTGNE